MQGQSSTLTEQPYGHEDEAPVPCKGVAEIVLRLTAAADDGKREIRTNYSYSLLDEEEFDDEMEQRIQKGESMPLRKARLCWNERVEFVSQEQKFATGVATTKTSRKRKLKSA